MVGRGLEQEDEMDGSWLGHGLLGWLEAGWLGGDFRLLGEEQGMARRGVEHG
jgi:hypothetical protein